MNERYNTASNRLATIIDRAKKGKVNWTPEFDSRFVEAFLFRNDAQNYMLFADPAARLRIPAE
jgi:hypothetical protein